MVGGAETIVRALLGNLGTLVVPTFTLNNSDPHSWPIAPVPGQWVQIVREFMPSFNPQTIPSLEMGKISELVHVFCCWEWALNLVRRFTWLSIVFRVR